MNGEITSQRKKENVVEAGRIAYIVMDEIKKLVKPDKPVIEVCEYARERIHELGGKQAFPCHVLMDNIAMNYTSNAGDETVIKKDVMVSVDLGVHINGYIGMTAKTLCIDPRLKGIDKVVDDSMNKVMKSIWDGIFPSKIITTIGDTLKEWGYKPIRNLLGHRLGRYILALDILSRDNNAQIEEGDMCAIYVSAVPLTAMGLVTEGPPSNIYFLKKKSRSLRSSTTKRMFNFIEKEYHPFPFASRWVLNEFPGPEGVSAFSEILGAGCLHAYPQLIEKSYAPVAQAQHTVIVTKEGCIVTTLPEH